MRYLEFFFTLPFKILFGITGIFVWEVLSNGEWKLRKRRGYCPLGYWQDQYQGSVRQNRENEVYFLKREEERDAQHQKELKAKEQKQIKLF